MIINVNCSGGDNNISPIDLESQEVGEFTDQWTYRIFPKPGDNFIIAEFRLSIPENINPRAILVLAHSSNGNGLNIGQQAAWQEYAKKEQLALLSLYLTSGQSGTYTNANNGSGNALLIALNKICDKNGIPEVSLLAFLMRGYSAGGVFSFRFSEYKTNRVIAFSNIRGGALSVTSLPNKNIPGLMIIGENDAPSGINRIKNVVLSNREENGLWSYAIEPNAGHYGELGPSDELTRVFFSSVLKKRITNGSNELKPIKENSGWLGNNSTKEIFSFDSYPSETSNTSWLVDENFAIKWNEF